jgi:microcystin-dependent protein
MPQHTHTLNCVPGDGTTPNPDGSVVLSKSVANSFAANVNNTMNPQVVGNLGGSQPHENKQPYLVLNFIIALQGIFPSQN